MVLTLKWHFSGIQYHANFGGLHVRLYKCVILFYKIQVAYYLFTLIWNDKDFSDSNSWLGSQLTFPSALEIGYLMDQVPYLIHNCFMWSQRGQLIYHLILCSVALATAFLVFTIIEVLSDTTWFS